MFKCQEKKNTLPFSTGEIRFSFLQRVYGFMQVENKNQVQIEGQNKYT